MSGSALGVYEWIPVINKTGPLNSPGQGRLEKADWFYRGDVVKMEALDS